MKKILLTLLMLITVGLCQAQTDSASRTEFHFRMGSSVLADRAGEIFGYTHLLPSLTYHATNKVTLTTGISATGSLMPNGYRLQGLYDRNLAPYKHTTTATSVYAAVKYQVNNRLNLGVTAFHLAGEFYHPWLSCDGKPMPLNATGVSADMSYRIGKGSFLDIHLSYIRDEAGSLAPLLYSPYYTPYNCGFGGYGNWFSPYPYF